MLIGSYNINGIRSAVKKGFIDWLQQSNIDILLLQETRAASTDIHEEIDKLKTIGYKNQYWYPAKKKGYSGLAILTKNINGTIITGCDNAIYDDEARIQRLDLDKLSIINVYMPSGSSGELRQEFKYKFLDFFYNYVVNTPTIPKNLIIAGDFNICHTEIDIHNPKGHLKSSGFLPKERKWLDDFFNYNFIDAFRLFNKDHDNYTWWSFRSRSKEKNLGWRIDYILASKNLQRALVSSYILPEVNYSDHCPVILQIDKEKI